MPWFRVGRYGPYLKKDKDTRSLEFEAQLFTVTLEEALALFAQPKRGRGRTAAPPLKELGDDPVTGEPIVVKSGRYGPYGAWDPQKLWWVVVLVTGFSFAGYVANRIFGASHGTIASSRLNRSAALVCVLTRPRRRQKAW